MADFALKHFFFKLTVKYAMYAIYELLRYFVLSPNGKYHKSGVSKFIAAIHVAHGSFTNSSSLI